jgi:cytochrome c2
VREQGARALRQYACNGCHTIPGLTGSDTQVGPPLEGLARRAMIAGRLPNTEENLVRWIRSPHSAKPGSAMPDMGVTEEHARQMAAYLSTLH